MRTDRYQGTADQGPSETAHSGCFTEPVHDPRQGTARGIPEDTWDSDKRSKGVAVVRLTNCLREEKTPKADIRREQQERHRDHKAQPMKPTRQPIHGAILQFATTTCLFTRPPARGDAALALASLGMMTWVLL